MSSTTPRNTLPAPASPAAIDPWIDSGPAMNIGLGSLLTAVTIALRNTLFWWPLHPIGLAISFFFMWAITGMGQPSTLVRLMAFRDSKTLRYSIIYLTIYNLLIYVPLIFIFIAARGILPNLASADDVMPRLVIALANPYVAGLILAAPYGAVLSTVSGWLLIISSGLVRDLYQRFLRPAASEREIAWASYGATMLLGLGVAYVARNPPT